MLHAVIAFAATVTLGLVASVSAAPDPIVLLAPGHYDSSHLWPAAAQIGWNANQTLAGVHAAIQAQNRAGGIRGRPIEIRPIEDEGSPLRVQQLLAPHMALPEVVGMLVPFALVQVAATQFVKPLKLPNFAPRTIASTDYVLNQPGSEFNMFLRQPPSTEVTAMLNFGLNSHLHCKHFFISFANSYALDTFAYEARRTLLKLGFPEPLMLKLPSSDAADFGDAAFAAAAFNYTQTSPRPRCGLMVSPLDVTVPMMVALHRIPGFDAANTHFISHSFNEVPRYAVGGSTAIFRNFYMTRQFPLPSDDTFEITKSLKRDFDLLIQNGYNHSYTPLLDPMHMEGYLAGRFAVEALRRVDTNITRESIRDTVYRTRLFAIDDLVFGPFGNGCIGAQKSDTGACKCNAGVREFFTSKVNTTTGFMYPVRDDPDYPGVARMPIPLTQCDLSQSFLKSPKIIVPLRDPVIGAALDASRSLTTSASPSGEEWQELMNLALRTAVVTARADQRLDQGPVYSVPSTSSNVAASTVLDLVSDKQVVMIAGGQYNDRDVHGPAPLPVIDLAPLTAAFPDKDEPWMPAAQHRPMKIPFYPTLTDLSMAAASYVASLSHISKSSVFVVADTQVLSQLAQRSVETELKAAAAAAVVPSSLTTAAATAAFAALPATAKVNPAAVLVVSRSEAVLRAAQVFAAAAGNAATVVLAADEFVLDGSWETAGSVAAAAGRLAFVSGLPSYDTGAGQRVRPAYAAAIAETVLAFYEQRTNGTAAAMMEAAYRSSGVNVKAFSIAPLYEKACAAITEATWPHPGGECQCAKGLHTFFVFDGARRAANATNEQPLHAFRHQGCGPAFVPLPPDAATTSGLSSNQKVLVGIAASAGGLIVTGVVAIVLFVYCTRSHAKDSRYAPKDPSKPFAMVFTDIQASTKLWAALPNAMGEALDAHNRLLRAAVHQHKGYEVKTIGDSFMVAFERATDALDFALAVQTTLYNHDLHTDRFDEIYRHAVADAAADHSSPEAAAAAALSPSDYAGLWNGIRVRVGVHFGLGEIKFDETSQGYDYYGTVVNTAARVEGVAHGGQVLLSGAALNAVRFEDGLDGTPPSPSKGQDPADIYIPKKKSSRASLGRDAAVLQPGRATVVYLGPQHLRGLPDPVVLYQVLPVAFEDRSFPPLRLEVEVHVDDDHQDEDPTVKVTGPGHDTMSDSESIHTANVQSTEMMAQEIARRLRLRSSAAVQDLLDLQRFSKALLSTMKPTPRSETIGSLADSWRVRSVAKQRGMAPYHRRFKDEFLLMLAVGKAMNIGGLTAGHGSPARDFLGTTLHRSPKSLSKNGSRHGSRRPSLEGGSPNIPTLTATQPVSDPSDCE